MIPLASQTTGRRRRSGRFPTAGLVSRWMLDEVDGTRFDSVASSHLTDVNTVGSAPGRRGLAASFVAANNEYLTRPGTDPSLQFGDQDFTVAAWINFANVTSSQMVAGRGTLGGHTTDEYALWVGVGAARFYVGNLVDVSGKATAAVTAGGWNRIVGWHDSVANTVNVQVNNGPISSVSYAGGSASGVNPFRIGATAAGGARANGLIDEVAVWSRVLTASERKRV